MKEGMDISRLLTRRGAVASVLFLLVGVVLALLPNVVGDQVDDALGSLSGARPVWLWLAAFCFVGSVLCTVSAWHAAFALVGGRLPYSDLAARYAVGSLVNSFSPARAGEAVRLALFARALPGESRGWRTAGVLGVVTAIRSLIFALFVLSAALAGAVPLWPVLALAGTAAVAVLVAVALRNRMPGRSQVSHLLDAFRALGRDPRRGAIVAGWFMAATAVRLGAAASIAAALHVPSPVAAAAIIIPTLDLAGLIPVAWGTTSGAVVVALAAHGVPWSTGVAAGLAFHAVETAAGIAFGLAGVLLLAPFASPRVLRYAAYTASCAVAVGLATTLLVQYA
jgi:uncharacterized membrane protein YbhN (UPF0104 family)